MVSAKDTTAGSLRELWNMKGTTELSYPEARDLYFCIPISVSLGYFWSDGNTVLILVVVTRLCKFVKIHWTIYFRRVNFTVSINYKLH